MGWTVFREGRQRFGWEGVTMPSSTVEEAQARLGELIEQLHPGEEIVITPDEKPVARLIAAQEPEKRPPQPGTMKGSVLYMAPDFDPPLEDFPARGGKGRR